MRQNCCPLHGSLQLIQQVIMCDGNIFEKGRLKHCDTSLTTLESFMIKKHYFNKLSSLVFMKM